MIKSLLQLKGPWVNSMLKVRFPHILPMTETLKGLYLSEPEWGKSLL